VGSPAGQVAAGQISDAASVRQSMSDPSL